MSKLLFLLISRSTLPMIYLATFCIQLIIFFSTGTYMIYKLKKSYMYAYRTSKNKVINNLYPLDNDVSFSGGYFISNESVLYVFDSFLRHSPTQISKQFQNNSDL